MIEFRMPSLGADMEDGTFVQWNIAPGQKVERGDVVCVVETQKGAIDVEIWDSGTVGKLIAQPAQRIAVGQIMALLAGPGEDWQAIAAAPTPSAQIEAPVAAAAAPAPAVPPAQERAAAPRAVVRISPAARKHAADLNIDLDALVAAHPGAPITVADVEQAAAQRGARVQTSKVGAAEAMRAAIAAAMARSKREIPHYYLGCAADVERAHLWLEEFNRNRAVGERVLFAALALRAIALALKGLPQLNGQFVDGSFRPASAIHLGVVTSLRGGGLVVPAVHDADRLSVADLMTSLRDVLSRTRSGQLRSSDLADSTITVTNLGDLGVETVYGVIYPPQVALIGLGRVTARATVRDGSIVAARTMNITLSADHRVSDGMTGARFLAELVEQLQHPEGL